MLVGTKADLVRDFAVKEYIEPARRRGEQTVRIRVGEVQRALHLNGRTSLICNALSGRKFLVHNQLNLQSREGPPSGQSTTVVFTYRLSALTKETGSRLAAFLRYRGTGKEVFRVLGGGEGFIQSERKHLSEGLQRPAGKQ